MKLELRSVRIKNCGPIDDLKLDFFDGKGETLPVCVIGGANGSGKTTILEAITAVAELLSSPRNLQQKSLRVDSYIQLDWRFDSFEVNAFIGKPPQDANLSPEQWGAENPSGMMPLINLTGLASEVRQRINSQRSNQVVDVSGHFPASDLVPSLIYLPHNRSLEPVAGQEIRKEEEPYQFVYRFETVRQFPGSLTSYLIWLDYAEPERYAAIQQFLNDLNFEGKTFRVDRKSLSVVVKTASGEEHPLHELSSGEQNLLIILIELHRKLTPGSIVLIDEIENSLHPSFQHRLAQGLLALQREIPYQLIVTTHAPTFVEIFGAENTRLLTAF